MQLLYIPAPSVRPTAVAALAAALLTLLLVACVGSSSDDPMPMPPRAMGSRLAPGPDQVRLVTSATDATTALGARVGEGLVETAAEIRVTLSSRDLVRYCAERADPYVSRVTLRDPGGRQVWEHRGNLPCPSAVRFADGVHTLAVYFYGRAFPDKSFPVFVHAPADAERTLIAPAQGEYWTMHFAASGRALLLDNAGDKSATAQAVPAGELAAVSTAALFAPTLRVVEGYEQTRLFSEDNPVRPTRRAMLNWSPSSGEVAMSPVLDALPAGANAVGAYIRPLGPQRFAYCFHTDGFSRHYCLGVAKDGRLGVFETFGGTASGTSLRTADPRYDGDAAVVIANPRYRASTANLTLRRGEVWLSYDAPGSTSTQGGLIYGEDRGIVPSLWTPAEVRLGPDTEVSLDGGATWIRASGPLQWEAGRSVTEVRVRRTSYDVLVTSRSCRGCDLTGFNLMDLKLAGVDLSGANLAKALNRTDLSGASLRGAEMTGAGLLQTRLAGADLTGARLRGAMLSNLSLAGARLKNADLTGAALHDVDLSSADASRTILNGAVFDGVDFQRTTLENTTMACVSMRWSRLVSVGFDGSTLQCVDLSRADLQKTVFEEELALPGENQLLADGRPYPLPTDLRQQCAADAAADSAPDASGFFPGIPCRSVSLRGAVVTRNSPPVRSWRKVDLSYATIRTADGRPPALANFDFSGGQFAGVNFNGARLAGANFERAVLRGAQFEGADLTGARLSRADLSCDMQGGTVTCEQGKSSLERAMLRGAVLTYANARGASFRGAVMNGVDGSGGSADVSQFAANLGYLYGPDTNFRDVDLTRVNLSNAQVYGANTNFVGSVMVETNMAGAILSGVDFSNALMPGANFTNANLVNAKFVASRPGRSTAGIKTTFAGAFLQGADLSQMNAFSTDFTGATFALEPGRMTVIRQTQPGMLNPAVVEFGATRLPAATDRSTDCPAGSPGACTGDTWRAQNPKEPTCVPAPGEFCPVRLSTD